MQIYNTQDKNKCQEVINSGIQSTQILRINVNPIGL